MKLVLLDTSYFEITSLLLEEVCIWIIVSFISCLISFDSLPSNRLIFWRHIMFHSPITRSFQCWSNYFREWIQSTLLILESFVWPRLTTFSLRYWFLSSLLTLNVFLEILTLSCTTLPPLSESKHVNLIQNLSCFSMCSLPFVTALLPSYLINLVFTNDYSKACDIQRVEPLEINHHSTTRFFVKWKPGIPQVCLLKRHCSWLPGSAH